MNHFGFLTMHTIWLVGRTRNLGFGITNTTPNLLMDLSQDTGLYLDRHLMPKSTLFPKGVLVHRTGG